VATATTTTRKSENCNASIRCKFLLLFMIVVVPHVGKSPVVKWLSLMTLNHPSSVRIRAGELCSLLFCFVFFIKKHSI
jgi:hypothetical protein